MKLKDLISTDIDLEIKGLSDDSRDVAQDFLFLAYQGEIADGKDYILQAIEKGAVCIFADKEMDIQINLPTFIIHDLKFKLSEFASKFYNHPSRTLKIIGVTGTNGKTTITNLIAQSLQFLNHKCLLLGTLGNGFLGNLLPTKNTTSGAIKIQKLLNDFSIQNVDFCAMEVSSHALHQGRVENVSFQTVVFSNITQDHLDYHRTMEEYLNVKKRFLTFVQNPIINIDDLNLMQLNYPNAITYSCDNHKATIYTKKYDLLKNQALVSTPKGDFDIKFNLIGKFNLSNLLALICVLYQNNFSITDIQKAIENINPVKGRMEVIENLDGKKIIIDYAHTPDALEKVLLSLKDFNQKILCLFGCGGDRDKSKRSEMAKIAEKYSDFTIITSDNPRSENQSNIFEDIKKGFTKGNYKVIENREEAILSAIKSEYLIILIAGKGHENLQEINGCFYPFDDSQVVLKNFKRSLL